MDAEFAAKLKEKEDAFAKQVPAAQIDALYTQWIASLLNRAFGFLSTTT